MTSEKQGIVIISQARMGSSRLPGKVLKEVCGIPLLEFHVKRLQQSTLAKEVIIATTTKANDDVIAEFCDSRNITCFRGSEEDVLSRYCGAAKLSSCEHVARVTSDCPLIDPNIIDLVFKQYFESGADYASNTLELTFPRGMDVEVFPSSLLKRAFDKAKEPYEREHVTPWIRENKTVLKKNFSNDLGNQNHYRLTVDTEEDFEVVKKVIEKLYPEKAFSFNLEEIIKFLEEHPEVSELNSHVVQKAVK